MLISHQTAVTRKKRQIVTCRPDFDVEEAVDPLQSFYILREGERAKI